MSFGLQILVRSLSTPNSGAGKGYAYGNKWQYHPRSDRHSKILCWGIAFDLLLRDNLIRRHIRDEKTSFGINHTMVDFTNKRRKDLDLVICQRGTPVSGKAVASFADMVDAYEIELSQEEEKLLRQLPAIPHTGVRSALLALEAKAAMTEFGKARPRLYDELNSSHQAIHGDTEAAIAGGFALINTASSFVSPLRNHWKIGERKTDVTKLKQPDEALKTVQKVEQLPRRASIGGHGFDSFGIGMIECFNDGRPIRLVSDALSPPAGSPFHYDAFIERIETIYATRFAGI
ncbi:hypothetical protein FHW12_000923 [Dokdonella fugitiva]|uniref:Uncharacterized protein n=1 Tax=Dokdonella fugitiva TaxID=328517 RepID=A0A839EYB4_9GAMM|nr:hypothetical protein [Dokdonella fugitiva]MBA8886732.1 hypothetical protein [Dokdonella fugitiva]